MTIASPCTGVCKLDEATGWCLGCGRTGDEMDGWPNQTDAARQAVWDEIPARLTQLGVSCRRLAWTTEEIRSFVMATLTDGSGTWVMGVVGAVAEFTDGGEGIKVSLDGDAIVAHTRNGAIRMLINDDVRAVTFDQPKLNREPRTILAVKRERGRLPLALGLSDLGGDANALIKETDARLFDLGLGRKEGRFCVRVNAGRAQEALGGALGLPFADALPRIGGPLIEESPTRVVESALGRIEVQGQIPPPTAKSPAGPHTHLLPDHLVTERALPVGMDLPRAYLPGAIFYPAA